MTSSCPYGCSSIGTRSPPSPVTRKTRAARLFVIAAPVARVSWLVAVDHSAQRREPGASRRRAHTAAQDERCVQARHDDSLDFFKALTVRPRADLDAQVLAHPPAEALLVA